MPGRRGRQTLNPPTAAAPPTPQRPPADIGTRPDRTTLLPPPVSAGQAFTAQIDRRSRPGHRPAAAAERIRKILTAGFLITE